MSNARFMFMIALVFLGSLLWTKWGEEQAARQAAANPAGSVVAQADAPPANPEVPASSTPTTPGELPEAPVAAPEAAAAAPLASGPKVKVTTDLVEAEIDLAGGDFSHYQLKPYTTGNEPNPEAPVVLFSTTPSTWYRAQSGWVALPGSAAAPALTDLYAAAQSSYQLGPNDAALEVPLSWTGDGLVVRKIYRFERGSYVIRVRYEIQNTGTAAWSGSAFRQLQRLPGATPSGFFVSNPETFSYVGAAVYRGRLEKLPFADFIEEPYRQSFAGGWSAMVQHHFVSAWLPRPDEEVEHSTLVLPAAGNLPTRYLVRQQMPRQTIEPGATLSYDTTLFAGPKLQDLLPELADGLELTVDYGMFTFLAKPLFWLLSFFHSLVQNWGFAIILLTLTVKLALYKLSEAQYSSMAKMRRLQPKLKALQERHGGDRQKMAMAQMELFKAEKVNPIGGCLPLLLQIPVFIALYWVIFESVELRQAPFIGWIQDLSRKDPYYVLPILNVVIMWYTQKLTPMTGMDPTQQKIFQFMPVMMGVLFAFFPAGLVLYWCMQGLLSLLQMVYNMRKFADPPKAVVLDKR